MRVHLVVTKRNRWVFAAETTAVDQPQAPGVEAKNWFYGKLESIYENVTRSIDEAQSGVMLRVKQVLKFLESRIDPSEAMIKQMRKADVVEIVYPPKFKEEVVKRRFLRHVRRRTLYHTRWLAINFLLLPLTSLMMILPGPNVFFGWNAFRLISHHLAREGGKRVLSGQCPLKLTNASEAEIGAQWI